MNQIGYIVYIYGKVTIKTPGQLLYTNINVLKWVYQDITPSKVYEIQFYFYMPATNNWKHLK
jgi:hypothetical protein